MLMQKFVKWSKIEPNKIIIVLFATKSGQKKLAANLYVTKRNVKSWLNSKNVNYVI